MPLTGFNRYALLWAMALAATLSGGCQQYVDEPLDAGKTAAQLLDRSLDNPALRDFLQQNLGRDLAEWPRKSWDFETLNWVALYYNPALQVARAQWAQARGGILTGAERPNPTIAIAPGYDFNPSPGTISPWLPLVTLDLPIETAGKREKRIQQAHWLAEAAKQNVFVAAWQVRADLRQALIDWDAAGKRAAITREQIAGQQRVLDLLQQRLQIGAIAADELSATRLALVKAQSDAGSAARTQGVARARIAEVLGVPLSALEGLDFSTAAVATGKNFSPAELSAARAVSLQTRADILAALANYQASQSALQLEIAKQYPDIHLGPGYQYDTGDSKWSLSIGADLPIFNQNEGPIAEAKAARQLAAAQVLALQAHIIAQIDSAAAANAAAVGAVDDLHNIDAELQKHLTSVRAQTDAGAADQLDYQTALLDTGAGELALIDAQAQAASASGQLEDAFQVPFANLPAVQKDPASPASPPTKP